MRLNLSEHKVQVIHGNVFQKPWVSEVCVHGELASQRGGVFSCIFGKRKKDKKKKETKKKKKKHPKTQWLLLPF